MTPEKAIEILNTTDSRDITPASQDFRDAVKLGIEATKLYIALKATGGVPKNFSGIGETEE